MVDLKEVSPGRFVVTAEYTTRAAAVAAFIRVTDGPAERAFKPLPPALEAGPPFDPPEGVVGESVAKAWQRVSEEVPPDDDEGDPIPGYRCATGACVGD